MIAFFIAYKCKKHKIELFVEGVHGGIVKYGDLSIVFLRW